MTTKSIHFPEGTIRWINVEMKFRTTSRRYFNFISTLFQCQMPAGLSFSGQHKIKRVQNNIHR